MKFKLDEHLPNEIADDLRQDGHDALTVFDQGLAGALDINLMRVVQAEGRVILTMDKGIANVTIYPPGLYAGIVLFRTAQTGRGAVLQFVRQHMPAVLTHCSGPLDRRI
jgi:predicted nuclease of predicted toxin-antitoxin system